jgi:hypothetical protein
VLLLLPQAVKKVETKPAVARARVRRVRFIHLLRGPGDAGRWSF